MANVFLVLCRQSPALAVKKRRPSGFKVIQRDLTADDPLPDPSWKKSVVTVVDVRGKDGRISSWLEHVAAAADGCVHDGRFGELTYLAATEATKRAKRFVAAGDWIRLAMWIRATTPGDNDSRRWETIDAIRTVVLRSKKKPTDDVVLALHAIYHNAPEIEELVVARAKSTNEEMATAAADILERRQETEDWKARVPKTAAKLLELFEGAMHDNASAERRLSRFLGESHDEIVKLVMKAIDADDNPPADLAAEVLAALHVAGLSRSDRERLAASTGTGSLATAFRAAAIAWREAAGKRAADYSQKRFEEYERYREDPLVATPRRRGDDIAMFRGLNDALYGPERDRPQLPLQVVALVCDRRFDEARAAYVQVFGEGRADAAINDAKDHFAPDLES